MGTEQLIISRVLCELQNVGTVALGPGLPRRIVSYLSPALDWIDLGKPMTGGKKKVDLAFVEAKQVSEAGDLVAREGTFIESVEADKWVVLGTLADDNGDLSMVKKCTIPAHLCGGVNLIITELGVVGVAEIGFELREISPGFATDDVRMRVQASLHVVDNIKRMQLCA